MPMMIGRALFENVADFYGRVNDVMAQFNGFKKNVDPKTGANRGVSCPDQVIVRIAPPDGAVTRAYAFNAAELIVKGEYRLATQEEAQAYDEQITKTASRVLTERAAANLRLQVVPLPPQGASVLNPVVATVPLGEPPRAEVSVPEPPKANKRG